MELENRALSRTELTRLRWDMEYTYTHGFSRSWPYEFAEKVGRRLEPYIRFDLDEFDYLPLGFALYDLSVCLMRVTENPREPHAFDLLEFEGLSELLSLRWLERYAGILSGQYHPSYWAHPSEKLGTRVLKVIEKGQGWNIEFGCGLTQRLDSLRAETLPAGKSMGECVATALLEGMDSSCKDPMGLCQRLLQRFGSERHGVAFRECFLEGGGPDLPLIANDDSDPLLSRFAQQALRHPAHLGVG